MQDDDSKAFSIAVLPYLKTSRPVSIGGFTFRSTTDTSGLKSAEAEAIAEIAEMLFISGEYRVASASYAVLPRASLEEPSDLLDKLRWVQSTIAYCYAAPHEVFGTPFLTSEHASMPFFLLKRCRGSSRASYNQSRTRWQFRILSCGGLG